MGGREVGISIVFVILAVVAQTAVFGEGFFTSTAFIKNMVVPAFYNLPIALIMFPLATRLIGSRRNYAWSS